MSYFPVKIQKLNEETEEWVDHLNLHSFQINIAQSYGWGDRENYSAGAGQFHIRLSFEFRWCKALEDVAYTPQIYRIVYKGRTYNIQGYDDYMQQNRTVRLYGEAYG